MRTNETFEHIIDGKPMRLIVIGPQSVELPTYLLQGEKAQGYLYKDGTLESWFWKGLTVVDGKRCLYFDPLDIFAFEQIASTKRDQALHLVRSLAKALMLLPSSFLDLSNGILPLWRIWGVEDGSILILPQDVADLLASCADEQTRFYHLGAWVHHGIHAPFSLIDQLASFLYFAAAGFPPFADKNTREDAFKAVPLSLCAVNLDKATTTFIDKTLSLSLTKMRDISGNKESQKALSYFLEQTEGLVWNLSALEQPLKRESLYEVSECASFLYAQEKRAKRKIFWRKKGWIVITVAVSVFILAYFTTSRIRTALAPPYTAGMPPITIIEEFYAGQNALDLQKMEASLAKKTKNPASMEVTNLFVTRQTRQAYEGINTQIDPNQWIEDGRPAIPEGTFLYGVTDLVVKPLGGDTYLASGVLYTPYSYEQESETAEQPATGVPIYTYRLEQQFTVEMGERGWYEITDISSVGVQLLEKIVVPTYPRPSGIPLSR
jgi:hypothetical protein